MRNLADKAFELSKKLNMKDEVKMIQEEERKLEQYLQQETGRGAGLGQRSLSGERQNRNSSSSQTRQQ